MVSALDSVSSGLDRVVLTEDIVNIVFLGKTLYSHGASFHPGV